MTRGGEDSLYLTSLHSPHYHTLHPGLYLSTYTADIILLSHTPQASSHPPSPPDIISLSVTPRYHLSLIPPRHHRHGVCLDVRGYRYTVFQTALPLLTYPPWISSLSHHPQTSSPLCVSMSGVTEIPSSRRHYYLSLHTRKNPVHLLDIRGL